MWSIYNFAFYYFIRFGALFTRDEFLLAAATHPQFKLHWNHHDGEAVENITLKLESLLPIEPLSSIGNPGGSNDLSPVEDLLRFPTQHPKPVMTELDDYLCDPDTDLQMLNKYPYT